MLYEQIVKRKQDHREKLINLGLILAGIILCLLSLLFLGGFSIFVITLVLVVEYFTVLPRRNIEVEYSFFEGALEISYIYNKEKRKKKLELDISSAEAIVLTESEEASAFHASKTMDFSSGMHQGETYSVFIRVNTELTEVLLEPNEQLLRLMKQSLGRKF